MPDEKLILTESSIEHIPFQIYTQVSSIACGMRLAGCSTVRIHKLIAEHLDMIIGIDELEYLLSLEPYTFMDADKIRILMEARMRCANAEDYSDD